MKIETKLSIGDEGYFMIQNKVYSAKVSAITTNTFANGSTAVRYYIDENPAGYKWTKIFETADIFATKQELLNTL